MKKIITACITVLGLVLVLALTVLVLRQNGFLVKPPVNPNPDDTLTPATGEEKNREELLSQAGLSDDEIKQYYAYQEYEKNAQAILLPGAGFEALYADLQSPEFKKYEPWFATVRYNGFTITKKAADFRVEGDKGYPYGAEFDRNGNITNDYSYVVVSVDMTCEKDWFSFEPGGFLNPTTSYVFLESNGSWRPRHGGTIYAWNPLTANPEHPCETTDAPNRYHLEKGVTYSMVLVFLMEDQYLPDDVTILLLTGWDTGLRLRDPVTKEKYAPPLPILSADGETLATYSGDPARDDGWFVRWELS